MIDQDEDVKIIIGMMSEHSGIWRITPERVSVLKRGLSVCSDAVKPVLDEMISFHKRGERFWNTNAEYYHALYELKRDMFSSKKSSIPDVVKIIKEGSSNDRVSHREWVKKAIKMLEDIDGRR